MISPTIKIFFIFLYRDFYVYAKRINYYAINYGLIVPLLYIFSFAYVQPQVYFNGNAQLGIPTFIGNISLLLMSLTYNITSHMLFDLLNDRFTEYQISILPGRLFIIKEILFASLWSFLLVIPFFPLAKFLLGSIFVTSHISWVSVYALLYLAALCCSAYHCLAVCIMNKAEETRHFWMRVNLPLFALGGFWVPWHIMNSFSPWLGTILFANPIIYITEGLRQAVIGGSQFLSITTCVIMLSFYICIFTVLSFYFFRKKIDYV